MNLHVFATLVDFLSLELNSEQIVALEDIGSWSFFQHLVYREVCQKRKKKKKGNKSSLVIFFYNEILGSSIFRMWSKLIEKNLNCADFHWTPSSENLKGENRNPK